MTARGPVRVALHGPTATAHDYHTGEPGSFDRARRSLADARRAGELAIVTTWLTRSSFRVLADMPADLAAQGVRAWCIEVIATGEGGPFERFVPRLALALPRALHAADRARRLGLAAFVRGAPLCLLGPHVTYALPWAPRAYGDACERCAARPACPGVDALYLERFGGGELRPRDAVAPLPEPADLAALFDGTPI